MADRDKWNVKNIIKKYLKIQIVAGNARTKKILSMIKVTNEHVHDSKALPGLIEKITKSNNVTAIGKLFAGDGTYDGNDILDNPQVIKFCHVLK